MIRNGNCVSLVRRRNDMNRRRIYAFLIFILLLSQACNLPIPGRVEPIPPASQPADSPLPTISSDPFPDPTLPVIEEEKTESPTPFDVAVGDWATMDADLSNMSMNISKPEGGGYTVNFHDDGTSRCGQDSQGNLYPADGVRSGMTSSNELVVDLAVTCLKNPPSSAGTHKYELTYKAGDDTIHDNWNNVWHRKGKSPP